MTMREGGSYTLDPETGDLRRNHPEISPESETAPASNPAGGPAVEGASAADQEQAGVPDTKRARRATQKDD